jgi:hypothetical protein
VPALADPATWRKSYAYRGWLFIDQPPAVFKARVDMASWTLPLTSITFDTVTLGAFTDATAGLTLLVGSTEGADDLGRIRLRKDSTADTLYPGEVSQGARHGELNIANNAYLTVLDWRIPFVFAPYIDPATEIIYKDYDLAVNGGGRDYASEFGPIANGGCAKADNIDPDTALATFEFDADNSLYVTPGSVKASVTWDVIDGAITVGNANSDQITATFPEGRRYVTLTVEDDDGNTHTHYILTAACNPDGSTLRPILNFEITDHRLAVEGGELAAVIYEDIDPADYPEGAQVIYYEHEYYDGAKGSLAGPSGDEHIKFVGWLDGEMESPTATLHGIENGVELRAVSTAGRMRQMNLFPQRVDDSDSPTKWTQMLDLTPQRFMLYLLRWHSNICDIANVQLDGYGSSYEGIETKESTLYDQIDEIAQEVAQRFTCDQRGTLRIVDNPLLLDSGDRTATVIVALTEADISEDTLERVWMPREYWIDASGITVGESQASKYSRAPGDAPGQGAIRSAFDKQLVADQTDLNARVGHEYARRNMPWEPLRLQMAHAGDAGIDPALMEWIEVTTTASTNKRQRALTDQRCLPQEVQIEHSNDGRGVKEVEYTAFIETVGTPGATYVPPTDPQLKLPAYQFPQFELYVPTWELPTPAGVAFTSAPAMYAATLSGVYRNRDSSSISWSSVFDPTSEAGANYAVWRFRLDPWNPKEGAWIAAVSQTDEIIKIFSTDDLDSSPPTWSEEHEIDLSSDNGILGGIDLRLSINIEGLVIANYTYADAVSGINTAISYRLTPISAWVDDEIANTADAIRMKCIGMGTHQVYPTGDIYFHTSTGFGGNRKFVYKSTDLGQNWAIDETISWTNHRNNLCLALPYLNNPNDEIVWFFASSDDINSIFRRNADGSYTMGLGIPAASGYFYIQTQPIVASDSDLTYKLAVTNAADIWTSDPNEIRFVSQNQDGTSYRQLVYSENGGATWINKSLPTVDDFVAIGSWPTDRNIIFAYGETLYWSDDKGDTWNNLDGSGGVALSAVASDPFVFDFVPVWVP